MRNRLISGLSRAVVVVEANEKSGSLITAACALEQGRDVMAVPGSVLSGRNRGAHALIRDGAKIVESADDIVEEIGWRSPTASAGFRRDKWRSLSDFEGPAARGNAGRARATILTSWRWRLGSAVSGSCRDCSSSNCTETCNASRAAVSCGRYERVSVEITDI